jgi:hypothetical protein
MIFSFALLFMPSHPFKIQNPFASHQYPPAFFLGQVAPPRLGSPDPCRCTNRFAEWGLKNGSIYLDASFYQISKPVYVRNVSKAARHNC